jgi:hypothetical protein
MSPLIMGPNANCRAVRFTVIRVHAGKSLGHFRVTAAPSILSRTALKRDVSKSSLGDWAAIVPSASNSTLKNGANIVRRTS